MGRTLAVAAAAAAVALATAAAGSPIDTLVEAPSGVRTFFRANVQDKWTRVAGPETCPAMMEFTTYDGSDIPTKVSVGHTTIIHDGRRCDGNQGDVLTFVSSELLGQSDMVPAGVAELLSGPTQSQGMARAFEQATAIQEVGENFFIGVDEGALYCGDTTFPAGTIYIFARPFLPVVAAGINMQVGYKYLLLTPGPDSPGCIYAAVSDTNVKLEDINIGVDVLAPSEEPVESGEPEMTTEPSEGPIGGGESPPPTPPPSTEEPACFPASASVQMADGTVVRMDDLAVGDTLRTSPSTTGRVYFFSHADRLGVHSFVRLTTAAGAAITLSRGHYLPVVRAGGRGPAALTAASAVVAGDELTLASGQRSPVVAVAAVSAVGLYAPHAVGGAGVVVDGVWASELTTAVTPAVATPALRVVRAVADLAARLGLTGLRLPSGAGEWARFAPRGGDVVEL
ncbi:hypothetical protein MMPV_002685 [Pyropia vietnamensis]